MEYSEQVWFDSDGLLRIVDNYANTNICSEECMFTDKINPIISNGVENICGSDIITKGIVTIRWSWTDDEGKFHKKKLNNVLYFPE